MGIKNKNIVNIIRRNEPYFEDLITRSVYNSNRIEGNTLSMPETYSIIFNNKNNIEVKANAREIFEAINLKYAYDYILKNLYNDVTFEMVKKVGKIINKNIKDIDGFRKIDVFIYGASEVPPKAIEVPTLVGELLYKKGIEENEDIFDYLARFHIDFEHIHPFEDGNGRTGRVLLIKELLCRNLAPLVIPYSERASYINYLDDKNVKMLSELLKKLNDIELERMKKFGIELEV